MYALNNARNMDVFTCMFVNKLYLLIKYPYRNFLDFILLMYRFVIVGR